MNQLIRKLEVQFEELQREVLLYQYERKSGEFFFVANRFNSTICNPIYS